MRDLLVQRGFARAALRAKKRKPFGRLGAVCRRPWQDAQMGLSLGLIIGIAGGNSSYFSNA
ncbi:hypothetical protein BCAR13_60016 [Paraburkholderia caribensis]|nr:hypothetical protein BCAR13_60016 [Paraburkholderia caribensis]